VREPTCNDNGITCIKACQFFTDCARLQTSHETSAATITSTPAVTDDSIAALSQIIVELEERTPIAPPVAWRKEEFTAWNPAFMIEEESERAITCEPPAVNGRQQWNEEEDFPPPPNEEN